MNRRSVGLIWLSKISKRVRKLELCVELENCMILYKIAVSQMITKEESANRVIMLHSDSPDDDLEKLRTLKVLFKKEIFMY